MKELFLYLLDGLGARHVTSLNLTVIGCEMGNHHEHPASEKKVKRKGGFSGASDGKESTCNAGDLGLIPGLGRSPGEGNGSPLQYSCLENSMDRGILSWWARVRGVTKSQTGLSD